MSATVGGIEVGSAEVEVVATRIAQVNAEVPVAGIPVERAIEVAGGTEGIPLPRVEDVAEVEVATLPVDAEDIGLARHTHQVVEVDLIGSLVLSVGQVQLVGHLVRQEQCLVAGLLVAHGAGRQREGQHGAECKYFLHHNRKIFIGLTSLLLIHAAK